MRLGTILIQQLQELNPELFKPLYGAILFGFLIILGIVIHQFYRKTETYNKKVRNKGCVVFMMYLFFLMMSVYATTVVLSFIINLIIGK